MAAPAKYSAMTYDSLVQQIADYANRNFGNNSSSIDVNFSGSIPYFIFQAQQRIWRESKDIGFEVHTLETSFEQQQPIIAKPNNWNKTLSIIYGSTFNARDAGKILEMRTYEYCRAYWPNANLADPKNPPLYYSDFPRNNIEEDAEASVLLHTPYGGWFIAPTPFEPFKCEITYLASVVNINTANQTNILTQKFPDVLFYASMCEAFSYTGENERIGVFENLYSRSVQSMNEQTQERHTDRTSKRNKD